MLIQFTVGNYRSFKDRQTLSLVAAPLKSKDKHVDANNVIRAEGQPDLLTSAAIYGANASGKSNLLAALRFMKVFAGSSQSETRSRGGIDVEPFRLNTTTAGAPSHFEAIFMQDGRRYRYGFEVTKERVTAEWLYDASAARESYLFKRDGDEIVVSRGFAEGRRLAAKTRPNALFLSVVAQFNGEIAQSVLAWFERIGIGHGDVAVPLRLYTTERFQKGAEAELIRRLVCRLDLGIADLKLEKVPIGEFEFPDDMPEEMINAFQALLEVSDKETVEVRTVHTVYDDAGRPAGQVEFDLAEHESDGTQKLFALSGAVLEALEEGDVIVLDELDARLHPLLTREIVRLFNDRDTNPKGAQLIFSTQDTNLLDVDLFRRDQIWFIEKNRQGASLLYSLAEFRGVRNDLSLERHYIQGRFGAIPYLSPNKLRSILVADDGQGA